MTATCTGAEFNAFMIDTLVGRDGVYFDDLYCEINGKVDELEYAFDDGDFPPETATILIGGGELYGLDPKSPRTWFSFEDKLREWLRAREVTILVIEVPHGKVAMVKSLLEHEDVTILTKTLV